MNKVPDSRLRSKLDHKISSLKEIDHPLSHLIFDNLSHIEAQCRKAAARYGCGTNGQGSGSGIGIENDADELFIQVLDRLAADDFSPLRMFRGKAKITTYLTSIIANLLVDIIRSRHGRNRAKERAREMGPVAERLYELVIGRGYSLAEAHGTMKITYAIEESEERLREILEKIQGRQEALLPVNIGWTPAEGDGGTGEPADWLVADPRSNAEELLALHQTQLAAQQVLADALEGLSGDELLMIRMRFPADEDEPPKKVAEIARRLNLSEKVVDSRIRRILLRCRELILRRGVRLDDLVE